MSEANTPQSAEAPADNASPGSDFDAEFAAFLGHSFDEPEDSASAEGEPPAQDQQTEQVETPPAETPPASSEAPPNADTPAGDNEAPAGTPDPEQVDPADLAAMLGLSEVPAATPEPVKEEPKPSAAAPAEDEPFMPFTPTFKLPKEMSAALFEAEDSETREAALVGLLSSFGNTITQVIEKRFQEHYAPALATRAISQVRESQAANAILQHFYGANQDLIPYKKAVDSAFALVAKKRGVNTPYTPELAAEVSKLTRAALRASGIQLQGQGAPAASPPPKKAPPSKAPGSGFEAGASRPSGASSSNSGPADLVRDLSEF
jgi:hypothetical protein